jgi:L-ascorbate metabolism protein UlaG (beta-lactamase superfamily)
MRVGTMLEAAAACLSLAAALILAPTPPARAQNGKQPTVAPDRCLAMSQAPGRTRFGGIVPPSLVRLAQLKPGDVRISYVGHSTFLIETPAGVRIATDYNDYVRPTVIPEIVTMNRAHTTHYTNSPDPTIRHVLRGWNPDGGAAQHDVTFEDVRVRNIPTNIRSYSGGTDVWGNSIFVFEVANLCIGHLGHLHHTLTTQQLAQIGQLDIVMVPVDGSFTLDVAGMVEVLKALKAPLMIPMHYFSSFTLERFMQEARPSFEVEMNEVPTIVVSRTSLPKTPKILVLPGN